MRGRGPRAWGSFPRPLRSGAWGGPAGPGPVAGPGRGAGPSGGNGGRAGVLLHPSLAVAGKERAGSPGSSGSGGISRVREDLPGQGEAGWRSGAPGISRCPERGAGRGSPQPVARLLSRVRSPPAPAQLEAKGRPRTCGIEALTLRCPVLPYRETPDSCFGALLFPFRYWCLTSKWIFKHAVA